MSAIDVTSATSSTSDALTVGRRVRHLRREKGWTLEQLGAAVGRAGSQLSLVENGRREPKLDLLRALADALGVGVQDLLGAEPPSRRAALEIAWERVQRSPLYASLHLPEVKVGPRTSTEVLEALVGMHSELVRRATEMAATPEEARRANRELREQMRARDNYYPDIEQAADGLLRAVGHGAGPLSQRVIAELAAHLGFTVHRVDDLPRSVRSVTDLRNSRLYVPLDANGLGHDARTVVLQTLGHFVLGHSDPDGYADFLRQRVESNYFAAALMVPERTAVPLLAGAKARRELDVEDLRDAYAVSQETAAHRFTNLATRHLGLPVHFMRVHRSGVIHKAYENDGVRFPTDATGAIEGQTVCRHWTVRVVFGATDGSAPYRQYTDTPTGTYWCTAHVDRRPGAGADDTDDFSVAVGVPYAHVKWFRGRETTERSTSRCPDPTCCRRPPAELSRRWGGYAWPSARAQSHLLATLPPGTFPGVDDTEVYEFLQAHDGVG
ncbi:helix-turn-helix domain-containing protein [Aquipuribacter sp. MA13-6]|uniref:helix-turn-helix domain-containing protein n=1 Tax=unclassified Aquipuribacter TaxID=2635084 RepID=UPI003EE90149